MKLFFSVFIVFFLILSGFPGVSPCSGSEKVSHLPSAGKNENVLSSAFASVLRNLIRSVLQEKNSAGNLFSILPAAKKKASGDPEPELSRIAGRLYLFLPADFDSFFRSRRKINKAVSLALLASLGISAEKEEKIRSSFITAAITHELFHSFYLHNMPYRNYTPGAMVLASHGIFPDLEKVFKVPLKPDSASWDLYGEYSCLLLSGLLRRKLFSGADFAFLIRHTVENGPENQLDILTGLLQKKLRTKRSKLTANGFFHSLIRRHLSNALMPVAISELEREYKLITSWEAEDHTGRKIQVSLPAFAEKIREVKNADHLTFQMLHSLLLLSGKAPGNTGSGLLWLRQNIIKVRNSGGKEKQILIDQAEQQFFKELEKQAELEQFLLSAEKFAVTPGTRFFRSMEVLHKMEKSGLYIPWGKEMESLLDRTRSLSSGTEEKTF